MCVWSDDHLSTYLLPLSRLGLLLLIDLGPHVDLRGGLCVFLGFSGSKALGRGTMRLGSS